MDKFVDRRQAGQRLAGLLKEYAKNPKAIVLALPRGGVPVAFEIAKALSLPLDVFLVRKLGVPSQKELAMGAIASGEIVIFNHPVLDRLSISSAEINTVIQSEQQELKRRELCYRGDRPSPLLKDKIIILVDDGIATGATMQAAITALREHHPKRLIIATPVAALESYEALKNLADEIICPLKPLNFMAVGLWYEDFSQTQDEEVSELLAMKQK